MTNANYFGLEIVFNLLLDITLRAGGKGSHQVSSIIDFFQDCQSPHTGSMEVL